MMVILVNTESPAWHGEMKVGDILMEIDGRQINQIKDYYEAVKNAHGRRLSLGIPLNHGYPRFEPSQ